METDDCGEQRKLDQWVKEHCEVVERGLWEFFEQRCSVILVSEGKPGRCIPPGAKVFHIVLRDLSDAALFHERCVPGTVASHPST